MRDPKAVHYTTESVIASSKCATLKHTVPGKRVLNVLFQVTVTFNHANVLKLTGVFVHAVLFTNAVIWWSVLTALH